MFTRNRDRFVGSPIQVIMMMLILTSSMVLLTTGGCQRKAVVNPSQVSMQPFRSETGPFEMAVDFMNRLDQFEPVQARSQILYNLRQWVREQDDDPIWIADPMFRRLPSNLKELVSVEQLKGKQFDPFDALVLQEAVWFRDVARTLAAQSVVDAHVADWLQTAVADNQLTTDEANDLSLVFRLFDWTIRNVQLDPEVEDKDVLGGEKERERRDETTPRYIYYAWENLLFGHGDWLERSRVFILLVRQMGIPVVMLSVDKGDERSQPWLPAALIGDDLYLFDTLLGLPLTGKDGAPITRLADLLDNPQLLSRYSLDSSRYRVSRRDLQNLTAAVDATPAALSQRMKLVETKLTGDRKTVLTVTPTPLAVKLRTCRGINGVEIWTHPYEGYRFIQLLKQNPKECEELLRFRLRERQPFEKRGNILRGRLLQLRGYYRGDEDEPGATKFLLEARTPNKSLAQFDVPFDRIEPNSVLLQNLPEDPVQRQAIFEARMQEGKAMAIWTKDLATLWLGHIAFDKQDYNVAVDYFQKRVLGTQHESPWRQSVKYNLARAYEVLGVRLGDQTAIDKAIELYQQDDASPQHDGNLLRAQQLRNRHP